MKHLLLFSLVLFGGCWKLLPSPTAIVGPLATKEGLTWTPKELVDYLNSKKLNVEIDRSGTNILTGNTWCELSVQGGQSEDVRLTRYPDHDTAKSAASVIKNNRGLAWGRFCFVGNAELVARIKKCLE